MLLQLLLAMYQQPHFLIARNLKTAAKRRLVRYTLHLKSKMFNFDSRQHMIGSDARNSIPGMHGYLHPSSRSVRLRYPWDKVHKGMSVAFSTTNFTPLPISSPCACEVLPSEVALLLTSPLPLHAFSQGWLFYHVHFLGHCVLMQSPPCRAGPN